MLAIRSITVDCADPYRQARWWSQATGWQEDPDDPNQPGDPEGRIVSGHGISLLFIPVPEGKRVKNRVHLDLLPERSRDEEVARLLGIGATSAQQKNLARVLASGEDSLRIQGSRVAARWLRDFVASDPAPVLQQVEVPVLAMTGGHDLQVPPEDVDAIGELVRGPFTGRVIGDLSHLLRRDPGSVGPRGYLRPVRQPVSPEVLGLITGWVSCHWGPR